MDEALCLKKQRSQGQTVKQAYQSFVIIKVDYNSLHIDFLLELNYLIYVIDKSNKYLIR